LKGSKKRQQLLVSSLVGKVRGKKRDLREVQGVRGLRIGAKKNEERRKTVEKTRLHEDQGGGKKMAGHVITVESRREGKKRRDQKHSSERHANRLMGGKSATRRGKEMKRQPRARRVYQGVKTPYKKRKTDPKNRCDEENILAVTHPGRT